MEEKNDQQQMMDVALKTRARALEELPHLQARINVCNEKHESAIAPLCGVLRSFARFTNSEDNIKLLHYVSELYASYAYSKQHKDAFERRNSKTIIQTLKQRKDDIEDAKSKGMDVDFVFDFFPLVRQYYFLLIRGHRPCNEEISICEDMLKLIGEISVRELQVRMQTIETCDKLLH